MKNSPKPDQPAGKRLPYFLQYLEHPDRMIAEDAFGEFKGTLEARPIFHWTDKRIVGHLTMCFVALVCEAHVAKALREKKAVRDSAAVRERIIDQRPLSAASVFHELAEIRAVPVTLAAQRIWVRTDIQGHAAKLFQALGLRIPPKLLKVENVVAQDADAPAVC